MNFGSWNGQKMVEKLGSRWKLFWRTFTSHVTGLHQPTNGDSTMMYPFFRLLHLRQHPFLFFHILNIPMYMSHSLLMPYLIKFIFSNPARDALLNIIHKVRLLPYPGHHGDLHHHPHHRYQFVELFTLISLSHPHLTYMDKYHLTNRALWICQTPVCKASLRFANGKKTDSFRFTRKFNLVHHSFQLFSRYSSPSLSVTLQLWLNYLIKTPWPHLLLALIHIVLHHRSIHPKALDQPHGSLDQEAFQETSTHLPTDPF